MRLRLSATLAAAALGLVALAAPARAQSAAATGTVTGTVVDSASHQPIPSARVTVVGAQPARETYTRNDGTFSLGGVPLGAQRVRVSIIGFTPSERLVTVAAGQPTALRFALTQAAVQLQEVVSVGYGETRRADVTGAISSVSSNELQNTVVSSLDQGLQGKVAGVQVTQGDAAPGAGIRVQIRGTNSMNPGSAQPLYVIDGIIVGGGMSKSTYGATSEENLNSLTETNPLASIAPSDIETIDVLKDASATAIYGSRGANGVVIITTKHGQRGRAGEFAMNLQQGFQDVVKEVPVLNAYQFATYVNTAYINAFGPNTQYPYGGRPGSIDPDSIRKVMGAGTNWQDLIFRTAPVTDGTLSFSGGDDQGSYLISGNLLDQNGVITGSQYRRGGARLNFDRNVKRNLRVSTNVALTRSINDMVRSSTINGYRAIGIVRQAVTYTPMNYRDTTQTDPRAEDPTTWATYGANPLRYTDEVNEADQQSNAIGGIRGVYTLPAGFSLDLNLSSYYNRRTYGSYYPRTVNEGRAANGLAVNSGDEYGNLVSDNLLRWARDFGDKHRIDAVGGFSTTNEKAQWSGIEVQGFANDITEGANIGDATNPQKPYSGYNTSRLNSWLGRVNYTLMNRYNFTGTLRADGSSKFAANNKWAAFPALGFAWHASEEPFLKNFETLSDLKLRASYGKSGNQAISPYQSLAAITTTTMVLGEGEVPAYVTSQLANPNLKWETTDQYDYGVDVGAWSGRLSGTVDYYRKNTYDLLQQVALPSITGYSTAWLNSGNVTNRGIEFQLGYNVFTGAAGGPLWNVGFNASHNRNRIEALGFGKTEQFANRLGAGGGLEATPFIQKVGQSIGTIWGYQTGGIVKTAADSAAQYKLGVNSVRTGDWAYVDRNGDGVLNDADRTKIGDANPTWTWGLTNRVSWKHFDASALLTAVRGNSIINAERMRYLVMDGSMNIPSYYANNAYDPVTNPNGTVPQVRQDRKFDARFNDQYVENGSYVRLKNVQLGYNLSIARARTARLYVNAINLATWTKYTGFDPEVSAFGSPDRPGVDLGSYPQQRTFTFGVNTTF